MNTVEYLTRNVVRKILSRLPVNLIKRMLSNSLLFYQYDGMNNAPTLNHKEGVWDYSISLIGEDTPIIYIEFGVRDGDRISYLTYRFKSTENLFIGLDTFDGLPEAWETAGAKEYPIGTFNNTNGEIPKIKDKRVWLVKGLFQETSNQWMKALYLNNNKVLLAHFDADLYSSTLFGLTQLGLTRKQFYCVFDEFYGDECRAFSDFKSSYYYDSKLLASGIRCKFKGNVTQRNALFLVTPRSTHTPDLKTTVTLSAFPTT